MSTVPSSWDHFAKEAVTILKIVAATAASVFLVAAMFAAIRMAVRVAAAPEGFAPRPADHHPAAHTQGATAAPAAGTGVRVDAFGRITRAAKLFGKEVGMGFTNLDGRLVTVEGKVKSLELEERPSGSLSELDDPKFLRALDEIADDVRKSVERLGKGGSEPPPTD